MRKKNRSIPPGKQTEELNRARWEFLRRNEASSKKLKELLDKNEKKRDEWSTYCASFFDGFNSEKKELWHFLFGLNPIDTEFARFIEENTIPPAVKVIWKWSDYIMELAYDDMAMEPGAVDPFKMDGNKLKEKAIELHCRDAKQIFNELTNCNPFTHLLLGIDLTRNKDVIVEELKQIVTDYQKRLGLNEIIKKSRIKWLKNYPEFLQVWDLYEKAGQQPATRTFGQIAKQLKRPSSTVKGQWYQAYEKIFREKYDPESKYTNEEKRANADRLCSECEYAKSGKTPKCYRGGDWHPCNEYLLIAGRERIGLFIKYDDNIDLTPRNRKKKKQSSDNQ